MSAAPLLEEISESKSAARIAERVQPHDGASAEEEPKSLPRRLAVYAATAGIQLVDELDHLCSRVIEPNIFFNPRFMAPAMPRLEDREIRLAVMRDGREPQSRLRLLVPFSIERSGFLGARILRSWANPYAPLGTPLIDNDDPFGVVEDFLSILARPHLRLPDVLVLPDFRLDGPAQKIFHEVAAQRNLPLHTIMVSQRPSLESDMTPQAYLEAAAGTQHLSRFQALRAELEKRGTLTYVVGESPDAAQAGIETLLALEMAGRKGRDRIALASDRYGAAFAREAIARLAQAGFCRVHTLKLDNNVLAIMIVFVENGIAYTWKAAQDEAYAALSPDALLALEVTRHHLLDRTIVKTVSCETSDRQTLETIWKERARFGTLVIGLTPHSRKAADRAARRIEWSERLRNLLRRR